MGNAFPEEYRPITRAEFHKLADIGMFEDERVELLDGVLVPVSPPGPAHSSAVDRLGELLIPPLLGRARVRVQNPFAASDISEPQPDVLVAPLADYRVDHPVQAHLVIEVAQSSLRQDRGRKLRIYALRGVPEYWIVDVAESLVEVYRDPADGAYRSTEKRGRGESISLLRHPDVTVAVSDIFG